MVIDMKVIGKTDYLKEKEYIIIMVMIGMKEILRMIKEMEKEYIIIIMVKI